MRIILASRSPRRRELLEAAGVQFEVASAEAEESFDASLPPEILCELNASAKAREVAALYPNSCVIGADTLVFLDGEPLGKPSDKEEAIRTLRRLSGREHFVCTGVSVITPGGERTFAVRTIVVFKKLSEETIADYLSLVNVLDKAGSYAFQEHGDMIIDHLDGDASNVIGLPVTALIERLKESGCL